MFQRDKQHQTFLSRNWFLIFFMGTFSWLLVGGLLGIH